MTNKLKAKATRVNVEASLQSFVMTTGDKEQAKYRTGFVPSAKDPNAVAAPSISVWSHSVYVPPKDEPARRGANDFLAVKSKGYRT